MGFVGQSEERLPQATGATAPATNQPTLDSLQTGSPVMSRQVRQTILEEVAHLLERRWGGGTLQRLGRVPPRDAAAIPTGFPALDQALGTGGLPRGRITEVCGQRSAGKVTLVVHAIAQAQARGGLAVYIDLPHLIDPHYLARHGVDLDYFLIAQPASGVEALEVADTLVRSGGLDLVIFDSVADLAPGGGQRATARARLLSSALRRLAGSVAASPTAFVFLNRAPPGSRTGPGGRALRFYASLRLLVERQGWLLRGDDVIGCRSVVQVLKNKLAPPFRSAEIEVRYEDSLCSD